MKTHIHNFCLRGMAFAWGGPVVVAIVWLCLWAAGVEDMLTLEQAASAVLSSSVMAFIAAGITIVYQIETLPKAIAGLLQATVLYVDYALVYLLNGWIGLQELGLFTLIFAAGFALIWFSIYIPIRLKVQKINRVLNGKVS